MFERYESGDRAILVHLDFETEKEDGEDLEEFKALASAAGAEVLDIFTGRRYSPDSKYFIGSGKAEVVRESVEFHNAELVLVDHALSPAQERNLEKLFKCRVLDRTGLILDIFAQRAQSFEGKLQVELAQLQYLSTRLIRGWTHLERQKGGIGLRGPGETQLETDRRLIRHRIKTLLERLEKVRRQRNQGRQSRKKRSVPTISLVGYTNAGKSTLFNALTDAKVFVADQLFATLDPTLRALELPSFGKVVLVDTVGFVRHLPHKLVEAFQATLEETKEASLLLHVIDASDEKKEIYQEQVNQVLKEVGAEKVPQLLVFNKIDQCPNSKPRVKLDAFGKPTAVWVSASNKIGLDDLKAALGEALPERMLRGILTLNREFAAMRSELFNFGAVMKESINEDGDWVLSINVLEHDLMRLLKSYPGAEKLWQPYDQYIS